MLFVISFTPVERDDYRVGVPGRHTYKLVLNSADPQFGGSDTEDTKRPLSYKAEKKPCDGRDYSIGYKLPPYGVAVFEF